MACITCMYDAFVFDIGILLLQVIPEPAARSKQWFISSSQWDSDLAKTASADYVINNMFSPVLFCEALQHVPRNAVVIEIAPHCLLQAILKRLLGPECTFTSLTWNTSVPTLESKKPLFIVLFH